MNKISILDMPEDLLDEDRSKQVSTPQKPTSENSIGKANSSKTPLDKDNSIAGVAKELEITQQELCDWAQEAALPEGALKAILRIAKRLKLNPLMGQIDWELNSEGDYELFIPIDGWIALIHREPGFKGLTFNQSPETEQGVPIWMECTIYCSDLIQPITVREYFVELKTGHPIWQQMPRRMLRYKTLQQCARLAFGICVCELEKIKVDTDSSNINLRNVRLSLQDPKKILKQKLLN